MSVARQSGTTGTSPAGPTELQRRRWYVLAVVSISTFMTPFDASIVSVALPVVGRDLHLSYSYALWAQAAYLLVTSALLVAAAILLAGFVLWEDRRPDPMLDLDLIRKNRVFAAASSAAFIYSVGMFAAITLTAVFAQIVQGYSPQRGFSWVWPLSGLGWPSSALPTCPPSWVR